MDDSLELDRKRPTVVVMGVESMLGANLALRLGERSRVVGFCQDRGVSLDGCEAVRWNPADAAVWARRIRQISPQWIVHCGGISQGSWDLPEICPDGSQEASVCVRLAKIAANGNIRLTVLSTDAVFGGPRMFHDENAPPSGRLPFARAARQMERALEATSALVVRTHAYGWSPGRVEPTFAERAWQALSDGLPCRSDPSQYATPILASDLADLLWEAYRRGLHGLCHIAGAERTSAYRFFGELALIFGLPSHAEPCEEDETAQHEPAQLHETSLNTRSACHALQRPMPMLREGLERFARQLRDGTYGRLRAASRLSDAA